MRCRCGSPIESRTKRPDYCKECNREIDETLQLLKTQEELRDKKDE